MWFQRFMDICSELGIHTHTHTHTHIYIYILYMYVLFCLNRTTFKLLLFEIVKTLIQFFQCHLNQGIVWPKQMYDGLQSTTPILTSCKTDLIHCQLNWWNPLSKKSFAPRIISEWHRNKSHLRIRTLVLLNRDLLHAQGMTSISRKYTNEINSESEMPEKNTIQNRQSL